MIAEAYPHSPGYKTRGPSEAAATAVIGRVEMARRTILALLGQYPDLTSDEAAKLMNESVLFIRPRFSELFKTGKIEDAGKRRKNVSGMTATAWRKVVVRAQQEFAL